MINEVSRDGYIKLTEIEKQLIDFFGTDEVEIIDILDALSSKISENEELERKLEEDYVQKNVDYYEEYGISEDDFH